ncbi:MULTISPECIES: hypothetical protein [Sphingobacterium]|uniref:Uncharacterized protein n=1 Tax=Sphingobacterium zeae TaxID=1776859 RepID=A0ABU0U730_9SPHI|nr:MULTISPECIES: hypothetical protein [Sphingobacterium]MDQ1150730.1 hypothetical protein [Sphingobacterium zeae]
MSNQASNYQLFSTDILVLWRSQNVSYIKVEELSVVNGVTFFELIPDSELLDEGGIDTLYPIDSEDVEDMIVFNRHIKFVVHDIYLDED